MNKSKGSPRKFSEKIALLNKKEAEANAEFERIIKEVEETTRSSPQSQLIIYATSDNNKFSPTVNNPITTATSWLSGAPNNNSSFNTSYGSGGSFDLDQSSSSNCFDQPISGYYTSDQNVQVNQHRHHLSVETPANVPNINIFPIDDEDQNQHQQHLNHNQNQQQLTKEQNVVTSNHYQQDINRQQVLPNNHMITTTNANNNNTHGYRSLDCSNFNQISSARSLPDIANLRVSSSTICSSNLGPSYSDQRINFITEDSYNNNYNNNNNCFQQQQQQFCNTNLTQHTTTATPAPTTTTSNPLNQNQPQQQATWQHIDNNSQQQQQQQHSIQDDQQQQQQQHFPCIQQSNNNNVEARFVQRANSTNPILCGSWNNNDDNNSMFDISPQLQHHKQANSTNLNTNLSKSSDFCYSYSPSSTDTQQLLHNNNHVTDDNCFNINSSQFSNNQLPLPAYRERSSSYNNIETIRNDLKTARYAQQQFQHSASINPHQNQMQQNQQDPIQGNVYADNLNYQFYEQI